MGAAEDAYAAAVAEIARVKAAGGTELDLSEGRFRALDQLPPEIAGLTALERLRLEGTQIADIDYLSDLIKLQDLSLSSTKVAEITPLSGLPALRVLALTKTRVADLAPLARLSSLQQLFLDSTRVGDLTPLVGLPMLKILALNRTRVVNVAALEGCFTLQALFLSNTQVADLAPIAGLVALQTLWLDRTPVAELAPLAGLSALQWLTLQNTQVADITPLGRLAALQRLDLTKTQVTDLLPLESLSSLQMLSIDNSPISDLRPLRHLPGLSDKEGTGLWFRNTPALRDPELASLSEIQDDQTRTKETLAYLRTLPPWPEPLPWEVTQGDPPDNGDTAPSKPARLPAPLQVAFMDGELREIGSDNGLGPDAAERERQGRAALVDYLGDFDSDQLARIENALPRLARAMARLNAALDADVAFNPIAAGMQGERVLRLSKDAKDRLMDDDGDDIAHLASQIALYLDRFLVWQAYRADATPEMVPVQDVAEALPQFQSVHGMLIQSDWSSARVMEAYGTILVDFTYSPEDPLAAKGLQDATR